MRTRVDVLGVLIDKVDLGETEEIIAGFASGAEQHQIVTVNVDFVSKSLRNSAFRDLINSASLVVADGMPILWSAKYLDDPLPRRITGTDIMRVCCRLASQTGDGVFLLGAAPGVADRAAEVLSEQYPGLKVAGTYSPTFGDLSPEEDAKTVSMINESGAKYLFVALGCPKQDYWIREHLSELNSPVCVGVGGVFNYLAGMVKQAPDWVQNLGLEWLMRMLQEPDRLARRYLVDDLPILFKVFGSKFAGAGKVRTDPGYISAKRLAAGSASLERIGPGS